jgi:chaperonin GroES
MSIRPLHDKIIVKRLEVETRTPSGIVLSALSTEKPDQGEVVAVGTGKLLSDGNIHPMTVKVGDRVLFAKYGGATVKINGDELLVMREEDLFAIVEK